MKKKKTLNIAAIATTILLGAFIMIKDVVLPKEIEVIVTSPNGGEILVRGQANQISWTGGKSFIMIGLLKPEASTDIDIASAGMIIGYVYAHSRGTVDFLGNTWDAKEICTMQGEECQPIKPGQYKLLVWSGNADGSSYIANGRGKNYKYPPTLYRGNWDVSDAPFTIQ